MQGVPICIFGEDIESLVTELARLVGRPPLPPAPQPVRDGLGRLAGGLLAALGDHRGCGVLDSATGNWKRRKGRPLTHKLVAAHLKGDAIVAPFHPAGPWPFVTIDVDRHNALQSKYFDETHKNVQRLFPCAFCITSSRSGGRHCYVRLPKDVEYDHGALVIAARFAIAGLPWVDRAQRPGSASRSTGATCTSPLRRRLIDSWLDLAG